MVDRLHEVGVPKDEMLSLLDCLDEKTRRIPETEGDLPTIIDTLMRALPETPPPVPPKDMNDKDARKAYGKARSAYATEVKQCYAMAIEVHAAYANRTDAELRRLSAIVNFSYAQLKDFRTRLALFREQCIGGDGHPAPCANDVYRTRTDAGQPSRTLSALRSRPYRL